MKQEEKSVLVLGAGVKAFNFQDMKPGSHYFLRTKNNGKEKTRHIFKCVEICFNEIPYLVFSSEVSRDVVGKWYAKKRVLALKSLSGGWLPTSEISVSIHDIVELEEIVIGDK